jgi:putative SOS response-associated peptidase YedK
MCGRFSLIATSAELAAHYQLDNLPYIQPRYNIAPTQPVAAVRLAPDSGVREWTHLQWGLVPSWSKDPTVGSRMINARAETAPEKPSFRSAFKRRRCLIPASGFYEWMALDGGKQPMYIHRAEGDLMSLAGLWEYWQSPDGSELETCTILTTGPNALMEPIHNRMPVVLEPDDYTTWLDVDTPTDQLMHLLRPAPAGFLAAHPVSTTVNNPRNEDPACITPLAE